MEREIRNATRVQIQIGQQDRYADMPRKPAPRTARARAESHDAARARAIDGAAKQRAGGIVGMGEIQGEGQKIGERIPQRRRACRQVMELDELQTHPCEICTKRAVA